ncbi:hypothetical protein [Pedobacter sp. SYSU D00535]|uniref:hypothetical protein n=1 Tax=Pedobacter sp. SYSU D00535 TaxID=2810308 RepID=UPI001A95896E|nr:hypothetical protein [Pedobacter sp. SYSU D00535]
MLKVNRTVHPDGVVVFYLKGMEPPKVKDMTDIMKAAVIKNIQDRRSSEVLITKYAIIKFK